MSSALYYEPREPLDEGGEDLLREAVEIEKASNRLLEGAKTASESKKKKLMDQYQKLLRKRDAFVQVLAHRYKLAAVPDNPLQQEDAWRVNVIEAARAHEAREAAD